MTVRLLADYDRYPVNAIVTLDAGTEAGLIAAKRALADTTGGVPFVPASGPVQTRVGSFTVRTGRAETIALAEGQALTVAGVTGTVGSVSRVDSAGKIIGTPWQISAGPAPAIGGFTGVQLLLITCTAGSINAIVGAAGAKSSQADRYMIASNRFGLPTDWATVDTAKNSDGLNDGRTGGTGTAQSKFQKRRYFFACTWEAREGRFLWANWSNTISGMLPGLFPFPIQRVEILSVSSGALIDTIKWSGATNKTLAPGERLWNDPIANLVFGGQYFVDLYYAPTDHSSFPACAPVYLNGEVAGESLSTDLSLGSMGAGVGASVGGYFGPCAFVAKGWDGSPVAFIHADSISDYQSSSATIASTLATSRGDVDHLQLALGDPNSGSWNYAQSSRYSSGIQASTTDNLNGLGGQNIIDWFADACALLQSEPVFNVVINAGGRNNLLSSGSATLASMQALDIAFVNKINSRYSGMPVWPTTITPYVNSTGNNGFTTEAAQTPVDTVNTDSASGVIRQFCDWRMARGGGIFAGCIDTASACRGKFYDRWKEVPFSATLITAVAANTTNVVTLSAAPPIGECLVFEPNVANVDASNGTRVYCVTKVVANGANWDCTLNGKRGGQANPPTVYDGSIVKLAHAAGVAVALSSAPDGLHPGPARKYDMSRVTIGRKAAIAASIRT